MSEKNKPSTSKEKNEDSNEEIPSYLNMLSEDFSPLDALYADELKPKKTVKLYSNLSAFQAALEKFGIEEVGRNKKKTEKKTNAELADEKKEAKSQTKINDTSASTSSRRFLEHQMPVKGKPTKLRHSRNLLKKMEDYSVGPLSVLHKLWKSQNKAIVYVRKQKGIRGYIFGYISAFDKHTNLLLKNCYEIWKRRKYKYSENKATLGTPKDCSLRLKNLGIILPEQKVRSVDRKYVIIRRQIDQIVIRGEQVCLIREANENDEEKLDKLIL